MNFGLSKETLNEIQSVFARYDEVKSVIIYGSRAKGNYKTGSDIDLTMRGESLDLSLLNEIANDLDDLLLPYTIDLSIYSQINDADLIDHIDRVGADFYFAK